MSEESPVLMEIVPSPVIEEPAVMFEESPAFRVRVFRAVTVAPFPTVPVRFLLRVTVVGEVIVMVVPFAMPVPARSCPLISPEVLSRKSVFVPLFA